jgi:serine/threonine-protein kinase TTK/MPS1
MITTPKQQNDEMEETAVEVHPYGSAVLSQMPRCAANSANQTSSPSQLAQFAKIINQANTIVVNDRRYIRLRQIGSGGGSQIFKVIDNDGNFFAIKSVKFKAGESELRDNYQNEIELLRDLEQSERIVDLIDSEVTDNEILIVLELGDADLREIIAKPTPLSPNYIRYTWQQMLEAVQTIHERKIVHGDLKPSNFLLVKGILKLIDFGIAKIIREDATSTEFTAEQFAATSGRYKAPENLVNATSRVKKSVKLGRSADVWSLGCILYELVYRQSPFPADPARFRSAVLDNRHRIEFPRQGRAGDFHDFDCLLDVMEQCLQRKASRRPSIEELLRHHYVQQPASFFIEQRISITDNLKQLAKQIQTKYLMADFESDAGRVEIARMARDLVCGRPIRLSSRVEE